MYRFKFEDDDLFVNRLKTYPEYNVLIYQGVQYTNNFEPTVQSNGLGGLTVFDINANRGSGSNFVKPQITSSARRDIFKSQLYNPLVQSISSPGETYNIRAYYNRLSDNELEEVYPTDGTVLTSSYAKTSQIKRRKTKVEKILHNYWNLETGQLATGIATNSFNVTASALKNVAKKYTILSDHFIFESSSVRSRDLLQSNINFIFIPQIYYGSGIKKGSVSLKYFITGSKIAECNDQYQNGILTEVTGTAVGQVVGIVLYDEGVIMLTASHDLEPTPAGLPTDSPTRGGILYDGTATAISSSWLYYGTTLHDGTASIAASQDTLSSASYGLDFKGISYVNTMTMMAHAKKGHLNHSNNPTYRDLSDVKNSETNSEYIFSEGDSDIKNIVSASFTSASFEKTTYISKINLYDENENLIGVASLATPVKKTIDREYLFKLKLDI